MNQRGCWYWSLSLWWLSYTTVFALPEGAPALALMLMLKVCPTLNATCSPCLITEKRGPPHRRATIKTFHLLVVRRDELIIKQHWQVWGFFFQTLWWSKASTPESSVVSRREYLFCADAAERWPVSGRRWHTLYLSLQLTDTVWHYLTAAYLRMLIFISLRDCEILIFSSFPIDPQKHTSLLLLIFL